MCVCPVERHVFWVSLQAGPGSTSRYGSTLPLPRTGQVHTRPCRGSSGCDPTMGQQKRSRCGPTSLTSLRGPPATLPGVGALRYECHIPCTTTGEFLHGQHMCEGSSALWLHGKPNTALACDTTPAMAAVLVHGGPCTILSAPPPSPSAATQLADACNSAQKVPMVAWGRRALLPCMWHNVVANTIIA